MADRNPSLQKSLPSLGRFVAHFWPYVRKQRKLIFGSLVALVMEVSLRALEPWPLKFVFDSVLKVKTHAPHHGWLVQTLSQLDRAQILMLMVVATVCITALRGLADYLNTIGFALVGSRVLGEIRGDLYRHVQRLSISFHDRSKSGDLILRVMGDVTQLKDIAVTAMLPLLGNFLVLFSMIAIMLCLNWKLALLAFAALPIFYLFTLRAGERIRQVARAQRKRQSAMAATAAESISAIRIVQALSLESVFSKVFGDENSISQKNDVKGTRIAAGLGRTIDTLIAISTATVLWFGARLAMQGALSPGDLLVFLTYLKRAFNPVQDYAKYSTRLAAAAAAGERVLDLLSRVPEIRDLPGAVQAPEFQGDVRFDRVSFEYEAGRHVLKAMDFQVPPGMHVALVGPSGIGKSTIVSLLLRFYDPIDGRVMIDGRDIREYTLGSLRSQISVLLQDSVLFAVTARENIAFGRTDAPFEEVTEAAKLANAHEFIMQLPEGYETVLGERGVTLSHGQRQRMAIARAAIRNAPILILDEPTTGLDEENERAVIEALARLSKDRTTFLVTHDLQLASNSDLIFYLEEGGIRESGTHSELMDANNRYAALFRLQASALNRLTGEEDSHAIMQ
jgi:ATP-binding cassette, subfamily B, bacterial